MPFEEGEMRSLTEEVIRVATASGHVMKCGHEDRKDVPMLEVAQDPELSVGSFSGGVRVGLGVRMPRLPALSSAKTQMEAPTQSDPLDYLEEAIEGIRCGEGITRRWQISQSK